MDNLLFIICQSLHGRPDTLLFYHGREGLSSGILFPMSLGILNSSDRKGLSPGIRMARKLPLPGHSLKPCQFYFVTVPMLRFRLPGSRPGSSRSGTWIHKVLMRFRYRSSLPLPRCSSRSLPVHMD